MKIDFTTQVFPILRSRCLGCHNEADAQGELRLDLYEFVQRGGHTGNEILGTVDDSELLRRITSSDDGYRMPKDQIPLSRDQVETIQTWIAEGAQWEDPSRFPLSAETLAELDWHGYLDRAMAFQEKISFLAMPSLMLLVLVLLIERKKRQLAIAGDANTTQQPPNTTQSPRYDKSPRWGLIHWCAQRGRYSHYLVGALGMLLATVSVLHWHAIHELREFQTTPSRSRYASQASAPPALKPLDIPRPHRPQHPPRLGGEYYRGNDERNARLFNGGFYRTATMILSLHDTTGAQLHWNSKVATGSLNVKLRIERAPSATPSLFRDESLLKCALTRTIPGTSTLQFDDTPSHFEVVEPGEVWQADYTIATLTGEQLESEQEQTIQGLMYLGPASTQAHYGIEYDIVIQEGRIDEESELWMGAILLAGGVQIPAPGKMPLSQWFGFQPIPEIVGDNTDDPDLLGITEHEKSGTFAEKDTDFENDPVLEEGSKSAD